MTIEMPFRFAAALTLSLTALAVQASAAESTAAETSPAAALTAAQSQYEFLIGEWLVDVSLKRPQGPNLQYQARWHNRWVANGMALLQEWDGPYAKGLELRTYSAADNVWIGRNIYLPQPADWYDNTAELIDGEMIVTTRRTDTAGVETISREIYRPIDADHFEIRTEQSTDDGTTWEPGKYRAKMTRK